MTINFVDFCVGPHDFSGAPEMPVRPCAGEHLFLVIALALSPATLLSKLLRLLQPVCCIVRARKQEVITGATPHALFVKLRRVEFGL